MPHPQATMMMKITRPAIAPALSLQQSRLWFLRGASRRWRDTWRHRRDVDVARDANAMKISMYGVDDPDVVQIGLPENYHATDSD